MEILKYPHPNLFVKCKDVTVFGPELLTLLLGMWDTMLNTNGIGLASNQVGMQYRMFVMRNTANEKFFIVNPTILSRSKVSAKEREGCLSAPGEFLVLSERSEWVELSYQDHTGAPKRTVFSGLYAVCVQHEMDHLDGKTHLQSKSLTKAQRKVLAKKWGIKK